MRRRPRVRLDPVFSGGGQERVRVARLDEGWGLLSFGADRVCLVTSGDRLVGWFGWLVKGLVVLVGQFVGFLIGPLVSWLLIFLLVG